MARLSPAVAIPLALLAMTACVLSAADRSVKSGAAFPALLSRPSLGAAAARRDSLAALQTAAFPRAEALAALAISRDPLQQQSAALLGAARLGQGMRDSAHAAFLVAGTLGWRDPITQLYWLHYAQTVNDFDMAAQRIDALLRAERNGREIDGALQGLEGFQLGQTSLAKRLELNPPWAAAYVHDVITLPTESAVANRAATLRLAKVGGMTPDCGAAARDAGALINHKKYETAATLWLSLCSSSMNGRNGLSDAGFKDAPIDRQPSPFEWSLRASGAVDVQLDTVPSPSSGKGIFARSTSSVREPVAQKWIALTPGRYVLSWSASPGTASGSSPFSLSIACPGSPIASLLEPSPLGRDRYQSDVTIADSACSLQLLKILIEPNLGMGSTAHIYDLIISQNNN